MIGTELSDFITDWLGQEGREERLYRLLLTDDIPLAQDNSTHTISTLTQVKTYWQGTKQWRLTIPIAGSQNCNIFFFSKRSLWQRLTNKQENQEHLRLDDSHCWLWAKAHQFLSSSRASQLVVIAQENQSFTYLEKERKKERKYS